MVPLGRPLDLAERIATLSETRQHSKLQRNDPSLSHATTRLRRSGRRIDHLDQGLGRAIFFCRVIRWLSKRTQPRYGNSGRALTFDYPLSS